MTDLTEGNDPEWTRKKRDIQIEYLKTAFLNIAMGVVRDIENPKNYPVQKDFELAISSIQLLGNKEEIELLHKTIQHGLAYDALLKLLRDRLRAELELDVVNKEIFPFRLQWEIDKHNQLSSQLTEPVDCKRGDAH